MTRVALANALYPTPDQIRNTLLSAIAFGFVQAGLVANILPGSDHYIRADKYSSRVSIAIANNQVSALAYSPLTAMDDDLVSLAGVFGVRKRPAAPSAGKVIIACSGTVSIPADFQCVAPNGQLYKTVSLSTATNGQSIDVIAVGTGIVTLAGPGTKVTWTSASIGSLNPVATVDAAGLTAGVDADDNERLRQRLLQRLAFPATGGNWSQVLQWAGEASASVASEYAYAVVRGPGSYDIAIVKAGGDRTLPLATINIVRAYIASLMPGQQNLNLTSVTAQFIDVTVQAVLPLPQSAGGGGGGWLEPNPWPRADVKVTAYNTSSQVVTVNGTQAPTPGNRFALWDYAATDATGIVKPAMRAFTVGPTVGGSTGAWTFQVVEGFGAFDPSGCYVSAGAVHLQEYADDVLAQFEALGPGEKSGSAFVLPLGRRRPTTDAQGAGTISQLLLSRVAGAHTEIGDLTYGVRYLTGTTTPIAAPSLPASPVDPPNILVLRNLAIRVAA